MGLLRLCIKKLFDCSKLKRTFPAVLLLLLIQFQPVCFAFKSSNINKIFARCG